MSNTYAAAMSPWHRSRRRCGRSARHRARTDSGAYRSASGASGPMRAKFSEVSRANSRPVATRVLDLSGLEPRGQVRLVREDAVLHVARLELPVQHRARVDAGKSRRRDHRIAVRRAVARDVAQRRRAAEVVVDLQRAHVGGGVLVVARLQAVEVALVDRRPAVRVRRQLRVGVGRHPGDPVLGQVVLRRGGSSSGSRGSACPAPSQSTARRPSAGFPRRRGRARPRRSTSR